MVGVGIADGMDLKILIFKNNSRKYNKKKNTTSDNRANLHNFVIFITIYYQ